MSQMKYINFKYAGFVIFEQSQNHSDIAEKFPMDEVESAGFVSMSLDEDQVGCHGDSMTLKTKPAPSDASMLYRRLSIYS